MVEISCDTSRDHMTSINNFDPCVQDVQKKKKKSSFNFRSLDLTVPEILCQTGR